MKNIYANINLVAVTETNQSLLEFAVANGLDLADGEITFELGGQVTKFKIMDVINYDYTQVTEDGEELTMDDIEITDEDADRLGLIKVKVRA